MRTEKMLAHVASCSTCFLFVVVAATRRFEVSKNGSPSRLRRQESTPRMTIPPATQVR